MESFRLLNQMNESDVAASGKKLTPYPSPIRVRINLALSSDENKRPVHTSMNLRDSQTARLGFLPSTCLFPIAHPSHFCAAERGNQISAVRRGVALKAKGVSNRCQASFPGRHFTHKKKTLSPVTALSFQRLSTPPSPGTPCRRMSTHPTMNSKVNFPPG